MTEDNNASEVLEGPTKAMNPAVEETGLQSSKGSLADSAISDPKGSTIVDSETNTHEPAKVPTAEEVKEPQIDASNDPGSVTQNDTHSEGKVDHTDATQADEPSKDEDCGGTKDASKRALEGQKWNNRDRGKGNFRKNVKSDLISQEESSDPVAIRKQVEFYFSNSNLLQDKFLYSKVEGHLNLPVPISIISSFKRMRHFKPHSAIVAALKESKILNVVENDSCIQRKEALPENFKDKPMNEIVQVHEDEAMSRSVYAKGFGEEIPSSQFDIEAFFAKHGPTNSVRLRRTYDKTFKGSVFVEFDSEESQQAFLALDPKPTWKGTELVIKSKKQYCEEKVEEIKSGRVKPNTERRPHYDNKSKNREGGKATERDWRDRRKEDQKGGFQDKRGGGHKGFGSSGKGGGRGGGRGGARGGARGGGRGGRDNRNKFDKRDNGKDEHQVPKIATTTAADDDPPTAANPPRPVEAPAGSTEQHTTAPIEKLQTTPQDTGSTSATDALAKKRTREADDGDEPQPNVKRVDVKAGEL